MTQETIGMIFGIALILFGITRIGSFDKKSRQSDKDLRDQIDAAIRSGQCQCPVCGSTEWETKLFPPHFYYAIDRAACGFQGDDSYFFLENAKANWGR